MSYEENPFLERLKKMPPVIAACAVVGGLIGVFLAVLVVDFSASVRAAFWMVTLIFGAGFCVGVFIGVVIDTLVFKPRRDKEEKRQRRLRRKREEKELREKQY